MKIINKKLSNKLLFFSVISVLIPILILSFVANDTIENILDNNARSCVETSMNTLNQLINVRTVEIGSICEYSTTTPGIINGILNRDEKELLLRIQNFKDTTNTDFIGIVDSNGHIITSTAGKDVQLGNIVTNMRSQGVETSFEIISDNAASKMNKNYKVEGVAGALSLVIVKPVYSDGKYIGSIVAVEILNNNYNIVDDVKRLTGDDASITFEDKRISTTIIRDGRRTVSLAVSNGIWSQVYSNQPYFGTTDVLGVQYLTAYYPIYDSNKKPVGMIVVGSPQTNAILAKNEARNRMILVALIGTILAVLISLITSKKITKPVEELKHATEEFGKGNYEYKSDIKTGDELEVLSNSFNSMAENVKNLMKTMDMDKAELAKLLSEVTTVMNNVSKGDFTARANENSKNNELQVAINKAVSNVAVLIKDLREEVTLLNKQVVKLEEQSSGAEETSSQVADAANQVATAASDQSAKVQDISDMIEEVYEGTKNSYKNAEETVKATSEISENSENGVKKVENAIKRMQTITNVIDDLGRSIQMLGEDGKKINEVTGLIKDIAEQTGLLALNASIEAARAGEAGKGFAVVASEIKALAEEIKKSVENINQTINGVHKRIDETVKLGNKGKDEVDKGVVAIDDVNNALLKINESVSGAVIKINGIKDNAKSSEINTEKVLKSAQDIAALSEEFAATAEELTASTEELSSIIEEMKHVSEEVGSVSNNISEKSSRFNI
ncbi:methyl-accepting chemotaxis sensory transducer [Methanococcus vannielii SB]|uniref:Methyl-accepting chemotaxis sensory transducer n=1 Tax=Methanococcus vannielii (strain ATCC 35089 / DSM 1224 / JCM 13029 / OCM 148 / SB) TaxID=406327 RepID=A6UR74_METVS|nr:methyl-accepting chemotaxis protein [Methanococcus vannielii]ABR54996.1 methyl-accepting chemotaxis sensory transducer [Methanococcus vannielii SB]